jgi:hypothetical protein
MERLDQPDGVALSEVSIKVNRDTAKEFQVEYKDGLLGGVALLHHQGAAYDAPSGDEVLYSPVVPTNPKTRPENLTFIPYYAWANRQQSAMQVWVPYLRA